MPAESARPALPGMSVAPCPPPVSFRARRASSRPRFPPTLRRAIHAPGSRAGSVRPWTRSEPVVMRSHGRLHASTPRPEHRSSTRLLWRASTPSEQRATSLASGDPTGPATRPTLKNA